MTKILVFGDYKEVLIKAILLLFCVGINMKINCCHTACILLLLYDHGLIWQISVDLLICRTQLGLCRRNIYEICGVDCICGAHLVQHSRASFVMRLHLPYGYSHDE